MKKDGNGFYDLGDIDPGVENILHDAQERAARRGGKSPAARPVAASPAPGKAGKRERDAQRNRRMIDLPEEQERLLEETARRVDVPVSSLIVWLVDYALERVRVDDLIAARVPSRSMKHEYILRIDENQPRKGGSKK